MTDPDDPTDVEPPESTATGVRSRTRHDRDALSRTLAALADPTRRAMLERLAIAPASVSELAEPFPMSLAAVSKHLGVLEDAGLVSRGRSAQFRPARLELAPMNAAVDWIAGFFGVSSAAPRVEVARELPHPISRVWAAWTTPELFARWFGTEAIEIPDESVVLEPIAGGVLRATMLLPDGSSKHWEGEFLVVDPPSRLELVLTDEPGTDPGDPIEVTLAPSATGTMLALVQSTEGFDAEGVAALAAGYGAFFDALDRVLASEENA